MVLISLALRRSNLDIVALVQYLLGLSPGYHGGLYQTYLGNRPMVVMVGKVLLQEQKDILSFLDFPAPCWYWLDGRLYVRWVGTSQSALRNVGGWLIPPEPLPIDLTAPLFVLYPDATVLTDTLVDPETNADGRLIRLSVRSPRDGEPVLRYSRDLPSVLTITADGVEIQTEPVVSVGGMKSLSSLLSEYAGEMRSSWYQLVERTRLFGVTRRWLPVVPPVFLRWDAENDLPLPPGTLDVEVMGEPEVRFFQITADHNGRLPYTPFLWRKSSPSAPVHAGVRFWERVRNGQEIAGIRPTGNLRPGVRVVAVHRFCSYQTNPPRAYNIWNTKPSRGTGKIRYGGSGQRIHISCEAQAEAVPSHLINAGVYSFLTFSQSAYGTKSSIVLASVWVTGPVFSFDFPASTHSAINASAEAVFSLTVQAGAGARRPAQSSSMLDFHVVAYPWNTEEAGIEFTATARASASHTGGSDVDISFASSVGGLVSREAYAESLMVLQQESDGARFRNSRSMVGIAVEISTGADVYYSALPSALVLYGDAWVSRTRRAVVEESIRFGFTATGDNTLREPSINSALVMLTSAIADVIPASYTDATVYQTMELGYHIIQYRDASFETSVLVEGIATGIAFPAPYSSISMVFSCTPPVNAIRNGFVDTSELILVYDVGAYQVKDGDVLQTISLEIQSGAEPIASRLRGARVRTRYHIYLNRADVDITLLGYPSSNRCILYGNGAVLTNTVPDQETALMLDSLYPQIPQRTKVAFWQSDRMGLFVDACDEIRMFSVELF